MTNSGIKWLLRFIVNYLFSKEARYCLNKSILNRNAFVEGSSTDIIRKHIDAAVKWILHAQDMQPDGGVTAYIAYSGRCKTGTSYPEVTGYIIRTMMEYHDICKDDKILEAANKMVDFELPLQMECGSFPAGIIGNEPIESVFNSAQVVDGLLAAYRKFGREDCLEASVKCCDWIVSVQEEDGSWCLKNYLRAKRTYDTKVDEALMNLYKITGNKTLKVAVDHNMGWVLSQQQENGWFDKCDNSLEKIKRPRTHSIGYTTQGLIECYAMNGDERLLASASKTLDSLANIALKSDHLLEGRYDSLWQPVNNSSDVSGSAQISICWLRLYELTGKRHYLDAAIKTNGLLRGIQFLDGPVDIRGAVPSSYPFWGEEVPFGITSWAVKYYLDSLIKEYEYKTS